MNLHLESVPLEFGTLWKKWITRNKLNEILQCWQTWQLRGSVVDSVLLLWNATDYQQGLKELFFNYFNLGEEVAESSEWSSWQVAVAAY